ncbi:MAG: DUF642 domain-containing protein [Gammaproteobacteria bacterium]|nr:DUF642 domain-containing protein [Gammaproteobacteria bacterium]MCP5135884.1 DUF642 domain-containing protein [Gammaproteobacteria bacterium]
MSTLPRLTRLMTTAAALLLSSSASAFVINGDFETTSHVLGEHNGIYLDQMNNGQWDVYDNIPGWYTSGGAGIEIQRNTVVTAHSTSRYVELDSHNANSNSSMSQNLTLNAGHQYELEFWYRPRTSTPNDNGIFVYIDETSGSLLSNMVYSVNEQADSNTTWEMFTTVFTAAADNLTLSFSAFGLENSLGGFIDDISLRDVTSSDVPVPAPLALMLAGALLAHRRRTAVS